MKKHLLLSGMITLGLLMTPSMTMAQPDLTLQVNGDKVTTSEALGEPYINQSGYTMIPLRMVNTYLGYTTDWSKDGSIHIYNEAKGQDIVLKVNTSAYTQNGQAKTFKNLPVIKHDRAYLPAREFVELYGSIGWDGVHRVVSIYPEKDYTAVYQVTGDWQKGTESLMVTEQGKTSPVELPEGYGLNQGKPTSLISQKLVDGKTYLLLQYGNNASQMGELFVIEGHKAVWQATVNSTSSYAIIDQMLYTTDGQSAGPWSGNIQEKDLLILPLGQEAKAATRVTQDFAINACTLYAEKGALFAIDAQGDKHSVKLKG